MATTRARKELELAKLTDGFTRAKSVVVTRNGGVTVAGIDKIRRAMQKEGLTFLVAKKNLIRLAAKQHGVSELPEELMEGSVALTFGYDDEVSGARLIKGLAAENEKFIPVGAIVGSRVLSKVELMALASLPSRIQLIGAFAARLNAPISRFTRAIGDPAKAFTRALKSLAEKRAATPA